MVTLLQDVTRRFRSGLAWSFGNAITLRDSSMLKKGLAIVDPFSGDGRSEPKRY